MKKSKKIYLDYAAATPIDFRVLKEMDIFVLNNFANCSALHDLGLKNKEILNKNRKEVANYLNCRPEEIVFTSGSTESNNLAILGVLEKFNYSFKPHLITTKLEHPSVLEVFKYLVDQNKAEVTFLSVNSDGFIDLKELRKSIKKNTILISIIYASGEIGTIQSIKEISKIIRFVKKNYLKNKNSIYPLFHTDATQAINYLPIEVEKIGIDLMTFNASKIYGPKGVGVLYIKKKTPIQKILYGGSQENNLRPGTENLINIIGLVSALKLSQKNKEKEIIRLSKLKNYFLKEIKIFYPNLKVNGSLEKRLPNNLNITFSKIPSDLLLVELSSRGIFVSEKSVCKNLNKKEKSIFENTLRFSFGRQTKKQDLDFVLKALKEILKKLKKWYN